MYKSSYEAIYEALRNCLMRTGVNVGVTAEYPRVELHSFIENAPLTKDNSVRSMALTVESASNISLVDAVNLNNENITRLGSFSYTGQGVRVFGIIPNQLQDLTEVEDTQPIVYRLLQSYNVFVEQCDTGSSLPDSDTV